MYALASIVRLEMKNMLRHPIYWVGWLCTILWALIWDSPLRSGELWLAKHCAYRFGHGVVTLGIFILAILFANAFRTDRITKSSYVLFTQPIKKAHYALGKFLGIFLVTLVPIVLGMVAYLFIPLAFKTAPYSIVPFIEVLVLYVIPSIFAFSCLCYITVVVLKEFLFGVIAPIILFLALDQTLFSIRIPGHALSALTYGTDTLNSVYESVLVNRGTILVLGIVLLLLAIGTYVIKKTD